MGKQIAQILANAGRRPSPESTTNIPVYFTLVRNSDGTGAGYSNADVDLQLDKLNTAISGTGLQFYRLGDLNYLDSDLLNQPFFASHIEETYSYVTTAFNVYLRLGSNIAPFPGVNPPSSLWKDNVSRIDPGSFGPNSNTYVHETGHNLGLLHTFGSVNLYKYPNVLTDPRPSRRRRLPKRACFPNPARAGASVAFSTSFDGSGALSLTDVHGKLMFAQKLEVCSGDNHVDLPVERFGLLPTGVYQVALQTEEGS